MKKKIKLWFSKLGACKNLLFDSKGPNWFVVFEDKENSREVTYVWEDKANFNHLRELVECAHTGLLEEIGFNNSEEDIESEPIE